MTLPAGPVRAKTGLVLLLLSGAQFLMTLDASVMNVSMATVANDLGTPITGIQTAIALYTLVMATLMLTGGKLGSILGRRRAFGIGLIIYGAGSLTTALAPNLTVLIIGWSFLEGMGAALIMPAIVALVATNFPPAKRAAAYGTVAASGAMAVAAGPLIGGAVTAFASWRYVFVGEVVLVIVLLVSLRRLKDASATPASMDLPGTALWIIGLGSIVLGVLRSSEWGWVIPLPGGPAILGLSPTFWMICLGLVTLYAFLAWQRHLIAAEREPLLDVRLFANQQLTGGLSIFFAQFLIQAGVFFAIPLFLSVVLELNALQTGLRVLPLSFALLAAAIGVPKMFPKASPRRIVRIGLVLLALGIGILVGGMSPGADASVVAIPMLLLGLGLGCLSSQIGAVTVSALPDERSAEVGGLQNTVTNLGASLGTALIGSVLITGLTASALAGIQTSPNISPEDQAVITSAATTTLAAGVPFISDTQLNQSLAETTLTDATKQEIVAINDSSRYEALKKSFAVTGFVALGALLLTGRIPATPTGTAPGESGQSASSRPTRGRKPTREP
jgi:EmrB/QacA subfamily drug resistance transporter